ncbi:hypothetical protein [Algivirga pacifica]|uniref:Uncharacterized protein n=1 Tax=Algivirga pacifica TaxID=1162670 RepID=A0ABP9D7C7_9BACT
MEDMNLAKAGELVADTKDQPYTVKLLVGIMLGLSAALTAVSVQVFSLSNKMTEVVEKNTQAYVQLGNTIESLQNSHQSEFEQLREEFKEFKKEQRERTKGN